MQVHALAVTLLAISTLDGTNGFVSKVSTSARHALGLQMWKNETQLKVSESLGIDSVSSRLVDALNDPITKESIGAAEKTVSESITLDMVRSITHTPKIVSATALLLTFSHYSLSNVHRKTN